MELSSEDYVNIWLRIKDRFLKWFISILSIVFLIGGSVGGLAGFVIAKQAIEPEVLRLMQTEHYKDFLATRVYANLQDAELRADEIQESVQRSLDVLRTLEEEVVDVRHGYFSILGGQGKRFTIQYGQSQGGEVQFKRHFLSEPVILVSDSNGFGARSGSAMPSRVTPRGFILSGMSRGAHVNWVAVGESY